VGSSSQLTRRALVKQGMAWAGVPVVSRLLNQINLVPRPTLLNPMLVGDGSFTLNADSGSKLPTDNFLVSIDSEIIFVSRRSRDTCTELIRGMEGTSAAVHFGGVDVDFITTLHNNRLPREINAIETARGANAVNVKMGGSNQQVQFNNNGVLGGDATFVFDSTLKAVAIGPGGSAPGHTDLAVFGIDMPNIFSVNQVFEGASSALPTYQSGMALGTLIKLTGDTRDGQEIWGIWGELAIDPSCSSYFDEPISGFFEADHNGTGHCKHFIGLDGEGHNNSSGTVSLLIGTRGTVGNFGSGLVDQAACLCGQVYGNPGTITEADGLLVATPYEVGPIGTCCGVRINPQVGTTIYGILIDDQGETQYSIKTGTGKVQFGGGNIGFFGAAPGAKPTITGSKGGNAALASLLTQLAALGLLTDFTT
jgi:hypothetical protein